MTYSQKISQQVTMRNTKIADVDGVNLTIRLAFSVRLDEQCDDYMGKPQLDRFPKGQFVAVYHDDGLERIIGTAHTMQKNQGFELREVIIDYIDEPQAGDSARPIV